MRTFVSAKIHGIRCTDKSVEYHGSVSICQELMAAAGIAPFEQVHVINLTNGQRWITYAIRAERGVFSLNGGGARLGEPGDKFVLLTYDQWRAQDYPGATVVHCDDENKIASLGHYTPTGQYKEAS